VSGDILGVYESLGNRSAHSITLDNTGGGGDSSVQFNVVKKIYAQYSSSDQAFGMGQGLLRPKPVLVKEIEQTRDSITISADSIQTWDRSELEVVDIKLITIASGLKIIVT
jgi:hypothetical protein